MTRPPSATEANALGTRIRQLRNQAGLSQAIAARHVGVARHTWQRWESGDMLPNTLRVPLIARALDVPIAALFTTPGTTAIADVVITDAALARIREHGQSEVEHLTKRLTDNLVRRLSAVATATVADTNRNTGKSRPRCGLDQAERLRRLGARNPERRRGRAIVQMDSA